MEKEHNNSVSGNDREWREMNSRMVRLKMRLAKHGTGLNPRMSLHPSTHEKTHFMNEKTHFINEKTHYMINESVGGYPQERYTEATTTKSRRSSNSHRSHSSHSSSSSTPTTTTLKERMDSVHSTVPPPSYHRSNSSSGLTTSNVTVHSSYYPPSLYSRSNSAFGYTSSSTDNQISHQNYPHHSISSYHGLTTAYTDNQSEENEMQNQRSIPFSTTSQYDGNPTATITTTTRFQDPHPNQIKQQKQEVHSPQHHQAYPKESSKDSHGWETSNDSHGWETSNASHPNHPRDQQLKTYDFRWESRPLGFSLMRDVITGLPCVKALAGTSSSPDIAKVFSGDTLILVNDVVVETTTNVMELLSSLNLPAVLRFQRCSSSSSLSTSLAFQEVIRNGGIGNNKVSKVESSQEKKEEEEESSKVVVKTSITKPFLKSNEYEILWEQGSLGMTLTDSPNKVPCVKRLTGKSTTRDIDLVHPGDELIWMNDMKTEDYGFQGTILVLKNCSKPMLLRFRRIENNGFLYNDSNLYSTFSSTSSMNSTMSSIFSTTSSMTSSISSSSSCQSYGITSMVEKWNNSMNQEMDQIGNLIKIRWCEGSFGFTMKEARTSIGILPIVARIKHQKVINPDFELVNIGDLLIQVNDIDTCKLGYRSTLDFLRTGSKPMRLTFKSMMMMSSQDNPKSTTSLHIQQTKQLDPLQNHLSIRKE